MIRCSLPKGEQMGGKSPYMVLVLDHRATRVLSSALTMFDVMQESISLVESLEKARQPMREMEVIYFIEPSQASVRLVCEDFAQAGHEKYADVHIFFTSSLGPDEMALIKGCPALIQRVQTFVEFNMDFLAVEASFASFDMPEATLGLYGVNDRQVQSGQREVTVLSIVDKLVTLCATMNEFPHIRYSGRPTVAGVLEEGAGGRGLPVPQDIAETFHEQLQQFVMGAGDAFQFHAERATVLIVDRVDDLVSTVLHEISMQAMVYDVLARQMQESASRHASENIITVKTATRDQGAGGGPKETTQKIILNDDNDMWVRIRHMGLDQVIDYLQAHVHKFTNSNVASVEKGGMALSAAQMSAAVKELPEYQQHMSKVTQQMRITQMLMSEFERLQDICFIEQTCASCVDNDGREMKEKDLARALEGFFVEHAAKLSDGEKLRLLVIFVLSQGGLTAEQRRAFIAAMGGDPDGSFEAAIMNLQHLGVHVAKPKVVTKRSAEDKARIKAAKEVASREGQLPAARWTPALDKVVRAQLDDSLSRDRYPYIIPPPIEEDSASKPAVSQRTHYMESSAIAGGGGAAGGEGKGDDDMEMVGNNGDIRGIKFNGPRLIVFVAGGITFSETRCLYKIMQETKREIVIGA